MSKKIFTNEEVDILSKNPYVKNVSIKGITYTDEFKRIFIIEYQKAKYPKEIFESCGFNIEVLGSNRISSAANRWCKGFKKDGLNGLTDTRKGNSGRPSDKEISLEEKYKRLEAENNLLKAENELLKKLEMNGKGAKKQEIKLSAEDKFILINCIISKYKLTNMLSYLCKATGVSRSGYYNYFSSKSQDLREKLNRKDELLRNNILKAYKFKRRKKGARQIKMTLKNQFKIIYNLKRIRRIMKKYDIVCPIRKANPYRRMMKATMEHRVLPNLLNREFKQETPGKVLLTDITYLSYGQGKRAYLSTVKDSSTNEILAYHLSRNIQLEIAIETIHKLMLNEGNSLAHDAFIHSDQGCHYTSPIFQKLLQRYGLGQSMSRRGNCWDNAPQESFFGHFKDEAHLKKCNTFEELKNEIGDYMDYYNKYRCQWGLKKMTPVQYRNHLLVA
nr:IS3 family transposase [Alkalicella caledoniensis]